jgi:hypothetical protein
MISHYGRSPGITVPSAGGSGTLGFFAECNTPPTSATGQWDFDTFYDKLGNAIAGGSVPAALAAIGVDWDSGNLRFDVLTAGWYEFSLGFSSNTNTDLTNIFGVKIQTTGSGNDAFTRWGPNLTGEGGFSQVPAHDQIMTTIMYGDVGAQFWVINANTAADQCCSYGFMTVLHLP